MEAPTLGGQEPMSASNSPFQRRYPPELRERAIRMVHEAITESGERQGAVTRVARQLGIGPESLRNWVKQAEIDGGKRPGVSSATAGGSSRSAEPCRLPHPRTTPRSLVGRRRGASKTSG